MDNCTSKRLQEDQHMLNLPSHQWRASMEWQHLQLHPKRHEQKISKGAGDNCRRLQLARSRTRRNRPRNRKLQRSGKKNRNILIANLEPNCTGKIIWTRKNQQFTIDYALINQEAERESIKITSEHIDESKTRSCTSDHNIIRVALATGNKRNKKSKTISTKQSRWKTRDEEKVNVFAAELENKLTKRLPYEELIIQVIQTVTDKVEKSKGKYRENRRPWYDKEVKAKIGKRREWNRQHRRVQKGGDPQSHCDHPQCYEEQRDRAKVLVVAKLECCHRHIVEEIKEDGKI